MEATLLKEEQIWGDDQGNGRLQVMRDYGTKTGMSDLAIVLGGFMGSCKTSDDQRTGRFWSASSNGLAYVRTVYDLGMWDYYIPRGRFAGARPALPSSVTSTIQPSEARPTRQIGDVQVVEYGEYPQTIDPESVSKKLEKALKAGKLQATGKTYTFDGETYNAYDKPFKAREYDEYRHIGKRYIRVEARPLNSDSVLSNGRLPQAGESCWIEVKPIEWLADPSGVWVARQALFSGVQFDKNHRYDGNFANTGMKQYLDRYFSKEMLANRNVDKHIFTDVPHDMTGVPTFDIEDKHRQDLAERIAKELKRGGRQ